jgi:hypothetical protein
MKKIAFLLLFAATVVNAQHRHQHQHHGHWRPAPAGGWEWVVPIVVGGMVTYQVMQFVNPPPPPAPQPYCSPWTEVQNPDGSITRTRTCSQ